MSLNTNDDLIDIRRKLKKLEKQLCCNDCIELTDCENGEVPTWNEADEVWECGAGGGGGGTPVTLHAGTVTQDSANLVVQELELEAVSTSKYGVMSPADKTKLDSLSNISLNGDTPTQDSANLSGTVLQLTPATSTSYGVVKLEDLFAQFERVNTYNDLPAANLHTDEYYHVVNGAGTTWWPVWAGGTWKPPGFYYSNGVSWVYTGDVPYQASQTDVNAGIITDQFISPATLSAATTVSHPGHTHPITDIAAFTKAQLDTAVSDGNVLYVGDITQYTDEMAQDAVGNFIVDTATIDATYNDAIPQITFDRAALTGAITAAQGSNATLLGSFTKSQLDTAVSDGNVLYVGDVTSNATHTGEVTGATVLTVDKTAITNKTLVTAVGTDHILIADASDSDNLKKSLLSDIIGQPADATLTALAAYNTNGLIAQTAADTFAGRTITGTANEVAVSNGDGVAGNPVLSLPATIDLGGKTSLEIPNSAAPTVDADGEIALDTTVANFSHGLLKYFSTEELTVLGLPTGNLPSVDGRVLAYNATNDELEFVTPAAGSGVTGTLNVNTTGVGNVGTGEDDLITYSVPAGSLGANGDYITGEAAGTFAASLNNKRVRVKLGSTTIFDSGALAITAATDWTSSLTIIRTGATTFTAAVSFNTSSATLSAYADYSTGTETLANALTLKYTGEATANDDVRQEWMVTRLNSATTDALLAYAVVANPLSQFAATTSLQLKGVISDETGSGALVFGTTPTLTTPVISGVAQLQEGASIAYDPAGSADGVFSGITVTGTGGATIAFGDLVTLDKDDSRWELVDISVAAAATGDARGLLGIAVTSSTDGGALTVLLNGIVRADANFPTLTIGAAVYASTTGDVVVTQPVTTDHVIRIIGYGLTADEMYFNPGPTWTTHT